MNYAGWLLPMARPIRIEFPGAVYHVLTRGNNRQPIFTDDRDRLTYLEKLSCYCQKKEVGLLCYCLLSNHVHLLLETPKGNLSKLMQAFQTSYTVYFNRRHRHTGHVFEQRYKAFLVDKDNYLLPVSRYIHLNPVGAKVVERPQDYRWSSYREYLKKENSARVNRELILGQFAGRIPRYRDFVEGALKRGEQWSELPVIRQAFIGDEDFMEEARKRRNKDQAGEGHYSLAAIVKEVCEIVGVEREELKRGLRERGVQRGRELFMYMARRHSEASLREIASWLGARDPSTVSHGVRRAETRFKEDEDFRRRVEEALRRLSHSCIHA